MSKTKNVQANRREAAEVMDKNRKKLARRDDYSTVEVIRRYRGPITVDEAKQRTDEP